MEEVTPRRTRPQIDQIGNADVVVGILDGGGQLPGSNRPARMVKEALAGLSAPVRTLVIESGLPEEQLAPANGNPPAETEEDPLFVVLPGPALNRDAGSPLQTAFDVYRSILALGARVEARACCVVASSMQTVTPNWFFLLIQPVLEMGFDVVTPCYAHGWFEGVLNTSVVSPLHQALYGLQIQNPMGPDLGFSGRALQHLLANPNAKAAADHPLISMTSSAISAGLRICQSHVGTRVYPPPDWSNASSLLAQVLDPIFSDIERNAAMWQRVRGSKPVQKFGECEPLAPGPDSVDVARMIDSFQLGLRDLREIWSLVLPPSTLFELTKISRLPQERFQVPDQLWARIVYDFALGHRLRTINRDHLLRAMTPLYLGWVASYALELETQDAPKTGPTLERLARAFETAKPYFVSRWRWPDRFNP